MFLTPWGRYRFTRAPMGLNAAGNKFGAPSDHAFTGLDIIKVVDNILAASAPLPHHVASVFNLLEACRQVHLTISPEKFFFAAPETNFVGFLLGRRSVRPDPVKLAAIAGSLPPV